VGLQNPRADFSKEGFPISGSLDESPETGWAVGPKVGEVHRAIFETATPVGDGQSLTLTFTLEHHSPEAKAAIGRFRLSASTVENPAPALPLPDRVRSVLETRATERSREEKHDLACYFRSITPLLKAPRNRLFEASEQLAKLPIATALVMGERLSWERPSTYLRVRGSYLNKGEKVYAEVPAILHPLAEDQLPNRLGLARWLVDEKNPLVARVTVNRFWEQIFGRGIVETSEDFGIKGARPTHPELLDWLATEFVRQGWSMKAILRQIVTSATYRQSSQLTPLLLERDPNNELLARGPRFRMEAEMVRDTALTASGLLSRKIGGPSVFPYQPEGVWSVPYSHEEWVISEGEDRYRRGLYTFWRRSAPYPGFMNFDATSREFCTLRRIRTNTPLQALTTLNDPAFFEAAGNLAKRILLEAAPNDSARAVYGFRLCQSRHPEAAELDRILALFQQQRLHFSQDTKATDQVIQGLSAPPNELDGPELAAWTVVSNVLLNLDQTLTKE
jgi:hypothetical protein